MKNSSFSSAFCVKTSGYLPVKLFLSSHLAPALQGKVPNFFRRNTARSILASLALFSLSFLPAHAQASGISPIGTGNGLKASYRNGMDAVNSPIILTRTDAKINFNWGLGSPDPSIPSDRFSIKWEGEIQPRYSGEYTFYGTSDDGNAIIINGQTVVYDPNLHAALTTSGKITLEAGKRYPIAVFFSEATGYASMKLEWSSANQSREVVPTSQLYSSSPSSGAALAGESFPTSRDKWLWPFAQNSIWNMPIGSKAEYTPANIQKAPIGGADQEYFFKTKTTDPLRKVYAPGSWTNRCSGTAPSYSPDLHVPDNLIVKDATVNPYSTPNNAAAFLMPDGQTLVQLEPLARCVSGGPLYGYHYYEDLNISGPGIGGSHFGSGLSAIGGSIRRGELTNSEPIRHALKVVIWGEKYLYCSINSPTPGYRWPATQGECGPTRNQYHGTNPKLVQGTLLAIPPNQTAVNLGLQTPAAKKLFRALQDYGAYVVDDAGWDAHYFGVEQGVLGEFQNTYGYEFEGNQGAFYEEFMKLFQSLQIVDNNIPNSIGGGGTPRQPLAPPFKN